MVYHYGVRAAKLSLYSLQPMCVSVHVLCPHTEWIPPVPPSPAWRHLLSDDKVKVMYSM